jgi:hypothetical protein
MKSVFLAGGVLGVAASVLILWVEKSGGNVFSLLLVSPGAVALFARSDALSPGPLYVSWVRLVLINVVWFCLLTVIARAMRKAFTWFSR